MYSAKTKNKSNKHNSDIVNKITNKDLKPKRKASEKQIFDSKIKRNKNK